MLCSEGFLLSYRPTKIDELEIKSEVTYKYAKPKKVNVWLRIKDEKTIYYSLPRAWAFKNITHRPLKYFPELPKFKTKYKLKTIPYKLQEKAFNIILESFKKTNTAFIIAGCAFGKSLLSLMLFCYFQKRILIVVDNKTLRGQWKTEEIDKHIIPTPKVYFWGGGNFDENEFKNADIVIGTIQTMIKDRYDNNIFKTFTLVIFDEVHVFAPEKFSRIFFKCSPEYILGITAEEGRTDGLEKVYELILGKKVFWYQNKEENGNDIIVKRHFIENSLNIKYEDFMNAKFYLAEQETRNKYIVNLVEKIKNKRTGILILSSFREHLLLLYYLFLEKDPKNRKISGLLYSGSDNIDKIVTKKIIFGIDKICAKSFNAPHLDTVIIALPFKSLIRQICGRVVRKKHKNNVVIYDIIDTGKLMPFFFNSHSEFRLDFYKSRPRFSIKNKEIDYLF